MTEHVGGQWMKLGLRFGCDWGFEVYFFHVEVSRSCTGEQISPWNTKSEWLSGSLTSDEERKLLLAIEDTYNQSNQSNTGDCRAGKAYGLFLLVSPHLLTHATRDSNQILLKTLHIPALVLSFPSQIDMVVIFQDFWEFTILLCLDPH